MGQTVARSRRAVSPYEVTAMIEITAQTATYAAIAKPES
jgi:hypothetical protein